MSDGDVMTPNECAVANMRRYRTAFGWSREDLAQRMDVAVTVIVDAERTGGQRKPRVLGINDVVALARAFGVSVDDMIAQPGPCLTCDGTPPRGFTCQSCGAKGKPAGSMS